MERWRASAVVPMTFGDLSELSRCARHAWANQDLLGDVGFWLRLIGQVEDTAESASLARAASYEIVVAHVRGTGDLTGDDERVARYFGGMEALSEPTALEDVQVLLMYLAGAVLHGILFGLVGRIGQWRQALAQRVANAVDSHDHIGDRCQLLLTLSQLQMTPDPTDPVPLPPDRIQEGFATWMKLLDLIEEAPLFPVERWSDIVSLLTGVLFRIDGYREFVDRLDIVVAERAGRAAAAGKCCDRAITLHKGGHPHLGVEGVSWCPRWLVRRQYDPRLSLVLSDNC